MSGYPKGRWSVGKGSVGASVWTREIPEGGGGGYYLYRWDRGASRVTVEELAEGTTREGREQGDRSRYVQVGSVPVPGEIAALDKAGQELGVAKIMYADMRKRFGEFAEWITYDTFGEAVWFHDKVINES